MPRNGSGVYSLPAGNPVVTGTTISSTVHNNTMNDLASEMTNSVDKDGQTVITGTLDFNGNKIVLDGDGDTSITADTDDRIDVEIGGSDVISWTASAWTYGNLTFANGSITDSSGTISFGNENLATTGEVRIGSLASALSSPNTSYAFEKLGAGSVLMAFDGSSANAASYFITNAFLNSGGNYEYIVNQEAGMYRLADGEHQWHSAANGTAGNTVTFSQNMTLDISGNLLVKQTSPSLTTAGHKFGTDVYHVTDGATLMYMNRLSDDGTLIEFRQDNTAEGTISVSGTTVSYNGGHLARWAQLENNNEPEILKGTVMSNLDEMCLWKRAKFTMTVLESEAVEAQPEVLKKEDKEGRIIQEYIPPVEAKEAVYVDVEMFESYFGEAKDGETIDFEYKGETYKAVVHELENEQLNKVAISSVEGDKNVAGVFVNWDKMESGYNDLNMAMTGDMIIRIAKGVTIKRGDLLESAGDGTARPQVDDLIKSSTIAKVTSSNVTCTYSDGSYCVPCVLMAC